MKKTIELHKTVRLVRKFNRDLSALGRDFDKLQIQLDRLGGEDLLLFIKETQESMPDVISSLHQVADSLEKFYADGSKLCQ